MAAAHAKHALSMSAPSRTTWLRFSMAGSGPAMQLEGVVTDIANDPFRQDIKKRREETPSRRFLK
jgi:hypothetical protein